MTQEAPKKKRKAWKIILVIILLLLAAAAGGAYYLYHHTVDKVHRVHVVATTGSDFDIDSQVAQELREYRQILLLGIDTREGESDEDCRSDASIVLSIHKETGDVKLISVMRDSFLDLEKTQWADGQYEHVLDKLTHAHVYGGPVGTIRAINRNLDMNIREYARVNWQTVADLVDDIGGLEVEIKEYEIEEMNKYIADTNKSLKGDTSEIKEAGKQTLNGIQAVTYCRIRKVGNGDRERARRMRTVFTGCCKKIRKMGLRDLWALADDVFPQITTNMDGDDLLELVIGDDLWNIAKNGYDRYHIKESSGWPYSWDEAIIDEISYDVPITLEYNVSVLHRRAFGQEDYEPTDRVKEISRWIADESGYDEDRIVIQDEENSGNDEEQ